MLVNQFRQNGLSLVELMVGLTVGLIVAAGAGAMYLLNVQGQTYSLRAARLNQDVRASMNLIVADVRRAGYWFNSATATLTQSPGSSQPYTLATTNLNILNNGTCIMYSYDADADASGAVETGEIFGFRLAGTTIEMLDPSNTLTSSADCTAGSWIALTNTDMIVVDSLAFLSINSQCLNSTKNISWKVTAANSTANPCSAPQAAITMNSGGIYAAPTSLDLMTEVREIKITIRGHHQRDTAMASTITETVHIPNHRIFYMP